MSRAAVEAAIIQATGLPISNVIVNPTGEGRPAGLDPAHPAFVVIRWQEQDLDPTLRRGERVLEVWVHYPKEKSTRYTHVDVVQEQIENALVAMEHVAGADGNTVTCIRQQGRSEDTVDAGYTTICRNSGFSVLYRKT